MKRRRKTFREKVVEMRVLLSGRKRVVEFMGAASVSSLKRWERRQCQPLAAHVQLVNSNHKEVKKVEKTLKKLLDNRPRSRKRKRRR